MLLGLVLFAVTWQVLARYVISVSTPWTVELASYSFVWLSMIGIALGVRRGRHMLLDVWDYLPYRRWLIIALDTIAAVVVVVVLALLVWFGIESLAPAFRRTMPGLGLPYAYVTLAVPVGAGLALIFAVEAWWVGVHRKRGEERTEIGTLFQPADSVIVKGEI
ncbi:TRAP transporter small permease [Planctomonas psychrotolerans]|uniref:TRAP transporter small permease n=1 Tax=Planctomonas psychrotolerans TaxID=2528712 RepID=UPI00123A9295|nr:TRAP transporter small permease subunit [Planctomonas psychrotolerans]